MNAVRRRRNLRFGADIASLTTDLASQSAVVRDEAREALEALGKSAVPVLIEILFHPNDQVRWEAAKALTRVVDPAAAPALVRALGDERSGVRWLAAEALAGLGIDALEPLLVALLQPSNAVWLREGAHHVLHQLLRRHAWPWLARVTAALDQPQPGVAVPPAAFSALQAFRAVSTVSVITDCSGLVSPGITVPAD